MKLQRDLTPPERDQIAAAKSRLAQAATQFNGDALTTFMLFNAACSFASVSRDLGFGDWHEHLEAYMENNLPLHENHLHLG